MAGGEPVLRTGGGKEFHGGGMEETPLGLDLMKTLIYSFLGLAQEAAAPRPDLVSMYDLWLRHLRGPGCYRGDILLITDYEELERDGVQLVAPQFKGATVQSLFFARVYNHEVVPAANYDVVLQTDLDVLAVRDVGPLFEAPAPFCAASSGLRLYDCRQAGNWRDFPGTAWKSLWPTQRRRAGVSASVFACRGAAWTECMQVWSRLCRRYEQRSLVYADQTILNVMYANQEIPIKPYDPSWIRHRDWAYHPDAILWHFPTVQRQDVMREHALC